MTTVIDRRGHLAQLAVQSALSASAFVFQSWIPLALGAAVFGAAAAWWPTGAIVLRLHQRWTARRQSGAWLDDGRPARISTALGAVNFACVAAALASGMDATYLWPALLVVSGALVAEVVAGTCVPCEVVIWLARRGWLPLRTPIGDTS